MPVLHLTEQRYSINDGVTAGGSMSEINHDELEHIANLIARLPSQDLRERCRTDEQLNEWQNYKNNQLLLAAGWRAQFIECQGDPIRDALEKQEISKHRHDMLQQKVILYKYQWELIQEANPHVKKLHEAIYTRLSQIAKRFAPPRQYPFESALKLFAEILREEVDDSFAWCLEPYYDVPVKKWREATQHLKENIFEKAAADGTYPELKKPEVDKLKNKLVWSKLGFSWLAVTLLACQFVSLRNPSLRKKLSDFYRELAEFSKLGVRASRKVGGFAWIDGKKVSASKAGGVYRK